MDTASLLEQLAPLREPPSVGWWPLAPGWWLALIITSLLIGLLCRTLLLRWRKNRYRRLALGQLKVLRELGRPSLGQVNQLLKATALRSWPKHKVAALHGSEWLHMLCASAPKTGDTWMNALKEVYRTPGEPAPDELLLGAVEWIRYHDAREIGKRHD
jgi:hypothetical protein